MRKQWLHRKLFTVKFKDREPRSLLWRKGVYREWFEFAKLAQQLGKKIPRAFGNLRKFAHFEDWWRDERYGFELFCEQPTGDLVTDVTGKRIKIKPDTLMLNVNLKGDLDVILREVRKVLVSKDVDDEYTSNARFQPSRPMKHIQIGATDSEFEKGIKRQNKLKQYRETYLLAQKMTNKEVAIELGWLQGDKQWFLERGYDLLEYQKIVDNRVKKVKRHCEQVERIFLSIANHTFP